MLWTDDFLFLHIPKTAGKSLTKAFVQTLGRPMTCIVPKEQQMRFMNYYYKVRFQEGRDQYAKVIESLRKQFDALMESRRWRVGNAIISLMTLSMFKKNFMMSTDHIKRFFERYDQLKSIESQLSNSDYIDYTDLIIINGSGHENIIAAINILDEYNKTIESFKAIVVAIRNPYDLIVSNYFFMRDTYVNNSEKENFQIAYQNSFEDYAVKVKFAPVENWMTINSQQPKNLRIIRFESLQEDFDKFAKEFNLKSIELPHINKSSHDTYAAYLTRTSEEAIYYKFKYLFDMGFYSRHSFGSHAVKLDNLLSS